MPLPFAPANSHHSHSVRTALACGERGRERGSGGWEGNSMSKRDGETQPPSRWKRDGVDLQALEDKLRIEIDPAFFEAEQDFR